jgi:hypothetical protein
MKRHASWSQVQEKGGFFHSFSFNQQADNLSLPRCQRLRTQFGSRIIYEGLLDASRHELSDFGN